MNMILAVDSR